MNNAAIPNEVNQYFANGKKTITNVTPNDNYTLTILFNNGEKRLFDMSKHLFGVFEILKNPSKFKEVFIDEAGNVAWDIDTNIDSSIIWNNRIDICTDSLYMMSTPITDDL